VTSRQASIRANTRSSIGSALLATQLASPEHRVQGRDSLDPHQRRGDELEPAKPLEADRIRRRGSRNARVDDELQRPSRESATAATQFGAGVPAL
jgi:hypothetical protein